MRKFYATFLFALMAITSFAQEKNDTTYVMFDFNANPWNYPVTTTIKGWYPDYDDSTGHITKDTDFPWPLYEGATAKVCITVYPPYIDPEEGTTVKYPVYAYCEENNDGVIAKEHPKYNMLFTYSGTTMRFKAPEGYKFGKMLFYFYKSSYFLLDTEEEIEYEREGTIHKDKFLIWIPSTPKVNKNGLNCWEGDESNIFFNNAVYFKANFMKIDMRLVPDGTAGIQEIQAKGSHEGAAVGLDGRAVNTTNPASLRKGIYVIDGKKYVVK